MSWACGARLAYWECDDECCPLAFGTLCHDPAAMAIRNFPADGKADAAAFVICAAVEALEGAENLLRKVRFEADPVILNADFAELRAAGDRGEFALIFEQPAGDIEFGLRSGFLELEAIRNEILEQLAQLCRVSFDGGQMRDGDLRFGCGDRYF